VNGTSDRDREWTSRDSCPEGPAKERDWDVLYREGTPPWETGQPAEELMRLVEEKTIKPCTVLEIGCGTGANAIYLAKRVSSHGGRRVAHRDRAGRTRCEQSGALLRIVLDDVFTFAKNCGPFRFRVRLAVSTTSSGSTTWGSFWICCGASPGPGRCI